MTATNKVTLASLKTAAATLGATVEDDSSGAFTTYQVVAPKGKVWQCDGVHTLCVPCGRHATKEDKAESFEEALERMNYGLTECDDAECEFCHPAE